MSDSQQFWAVIPAAGAGKRMLADRPKQYLSLAGSTVLEHTLSLFCSHEDVSGVVVAIDPDDAYWPSLAFAGKDAVTVVRGGKQRCHSVLNALNGLAGIAVNDDWVLVHDAARPCLPQSDLHKLMTELKDDSTGGILALPVTDTLKRANDDRTVCETVDRISLWRALTPQMFQLGTLKTALEWCLQNDIQVTDEASAMEHAGFRPRLIQGQSRNIKITQPGDLVLAEYYLSRPQC